MARWVFGAGLSALVAFAHAQPAYSSHYGGGGGFQRAPMASPVSPMASPKSGAAPRDGWGMREASPARRESPSFPGYRVGSGGSGRYGAAPTRVADQGGWRERGGRAGRGGRGDGSQPDRAPGGNYGGNYGGGYGAYHSGPITPVSAETRPVPHPPADSPVRAGSIREDVARYNEERGSFRPFPRGSGEVPRPPMPSPYRN